MKYTARQTKQLTAPEKHLLLTGDCCPEKGTWKEQGEKTFRTFSLVSPAGRDELRELWNQNREELIAEWKGAGKRGLPWAVKEFERSDKGAAVIRRKPETINT